MKSYVELKVPLNQDSPWFQELRQALSLYQVSWQKGFFHITLAFLDETPNTDDISNLVKSHFDGVSPISLRFDKLDVFSTHPGGMYIINLTTSQVPEDFLSRVVKIRENITKAGGVLQSGFRLHVTLGRLRDSKVGIRKLQNLVSDVDLIPFTLELKDIEYRVFRGETLYKCKL